MNIIPVNVANNKDRASIAGFTDDQSKAYSELIEFMNKPYDEKDYKRALSGPAGTGKTYLVRALIKNCNYSHSVIGLAAPTHKACRVLTESIGLPNIKATTIASDLGLRPNYEAANFDVDNPPFDPRGKIKIDKYQIYICDEGSMINKSMFGLLEKKCKQAHVKIIYIGDAYQLPPVNEKYSPAFKGVKTYRLTQIVRQDDDNPIRELLELLRYDIEHNSFKFLEFISRNKSKFDEGFTKGYQVCNLKEFGDHIRTYFSDPQLTQNVDFCKVIGYTNMCVSSWNKFIRENTIQDAEKSVITKHDLIISYTTLVDAFGGTIIINSEDYIIKEIVNYTHPDYNLKGFLVKFIQIFGGQVTQPLFVLDHRDMETMKQYVTISNQMINVAKTCPAKFRAEKWRQYYEFKESCLLLIDIYNSSGYKLYSRSADYGFALTAHKSQGSTFDTTFVDVQDIVYNKYGQIRPDVEDINRRLYVACSRCRNKLYLKFGN